MDASLREIMTPWKKLLLNSYYCATLPARRRAEAVRAAEQSEPVRILFYHRIADEHPNDWTMSTRMFARQIHWLRSHFELVSLAEAQARIASGHNRVPTACITFDDGYADNMRFAIPLLACHRIPFTYFVSTDHVLRGDHFPHDVAAGRPLAPNTMSDLRAIAAAGAEIGAHTQSHADLGRLTADKLADEIVGSKYELQDALDCDVRYFAFPFGLHANMSNEAFQVAMNAEYAGVCSAYGGYNFPADNAFHLRRFHADPELVRFKNWLTVDPRKVRAQKEFIFKQCEAPSGAQDTATRGQGDKERTLLAPVSPCLPVSLSPCPAPTPTH